MKTGRIALGQILSAETMPAGTQPVTPVLIGMGENPK